MACQEDPEPCKCPKDSNDVLSMVSGTRLEIRAEDELVPTSHTLSLDLVVGNNLLVRDITMRHRARVETYLLLLVKKSPDYVF